jgi:hypothetical protein
MSRNFFEHLSALIVSGVFMLWGTRVHALGNTLAVKDYFSPLAFSGYVETYYGVDFNKPPGGRRPPFLYNFTEDKEVAVNLALLKGSYITNNIRANLALAAGSYMNANYAAEPGILGHLYESNVGIKLSGNHELWLDIGVFPSHIGFESAIGTDNWTLTRSLVAENTPYFESGAKLGYRTDNDKWFFSALILNGWQRIKPLEGNRLPAFGTQITYTPSPAITLNSSSFFGSDKPDHARQIRYFHNFYGIFKLDDALAATIGFDIGIEQRNEHSSNMDMWFNPTVLLRYTPSPKTAVAVRAEYYDDRHGVIVASDTPHGFKTWGFSANFDYHVTTSIVWRVEARTLESKDQIFTQKDGSKSNGNTFLTTSLAISF